MQKKICIFLFFFFSSLFNIFPAHAETQSARNFVYDFYIWYVQESVKSTLNLNNYDSPMAGMHPINNNKIYKYVFQCTVQNCRKNLLQGSNDTDYFLKSNDVWIEMLKGLNVRDAVPVSEDVSIVPVSFDLHLVSNPQFIVFVKKEGDKLYIIKVEDSFMNYQ